MMIARTNSALKLVDALIHSQNVLSMLYKSYTRSNAQSQRGLQWNTIIGHAIRIELQQTDKQH